MLCWVYAPHLFGNGRAAIIGDWLKTEASFLV
jgi:hypothetical protein